MRAISIPIKLFAGLSLRRDRTTAQPFTVRSAFDEAINHAVLSLHEPSPTGLKPSSGQRDSGPVSTDTIFGTFYGDRGSGGPRSVVWLRTIFTFATPINAFAADIKNEVASQGGHRFVVTVGNDEDMIADPSVNSKFVSGVQSFIGLFNQRGSFTRVTVSNIDGGDFVRFGSLRFGLLPMAAQVTAPSVVRRPSGTEYGQAVGAN